MAGQDATEAGRRVGVSRSVAGAVMLGCLALGMLFGTIFSTTSSSSPNLRDANAQKQAPEKRVTPLLDHAGDGHSHGDQLVAGDGGGFDDVQLGSPVVAWGPDADALDDFTILAEAGAFGPDDKENAAWNNLFGADAQLHKVDGDQLVEGKGNGGAADVDVGSPVGVWGKDDKENAAWDDLLGAEAQLLQVDGAGAGHGDEEQLSGGAAAGAWGEDADARNDWTAGAWGAHDTENAAWDNLIGGKATLGLDELYDDNSYSYDL